ncbi:hypothetical protein [Gallaecimonas sp. GXIMD4217]|uniref:hypothetical protein n=1 Tax=Gallaecimonas sp. GXIMD4217 TaxID=3131927 RepID=UPI00311B2CD8
MIRWQQQITRADCRRLYGALLEDGKGKRRFERALRWTLYGAVLAGLSMEVGPGWHWPTALLVAALGAMTVNEVLQNVRLMRLDALTGLCDCELDGQALRLALEGKVLSFPLAEVRRARRLAGGDRVLFLGQWPVLLKAEALPEQTKGLLDGPDHLT